MTDDQSLAIGNVDPEGRTRPGELHIDIGKRPSTEAKPLAEGGGDGPLPGADRPDRSALLSEAFRRGLLPPEKKALFEEAQRRGIVQGPAVDELSGTLIAGSHAANEIVPAAKRRFEAMQARAKDAFDQAEGRDKDVDYDAGISFLDQVALSQADNDGEKQLYLQNRYGQSNVGQDRGGRFWVKIGNRKVAAEPGLTADVVGLGPEMVGGGAGAALGASIGGLPGAIGGAALGTGLGKSATEAVKGLAGRSNKNLAQTMATINKEGLLGGLGEGIARPLTTLAVGPIPRFLAGQTPESQDMTALTLRGGAIPPVKSALPSAKRLQFKQLLSRKSVGPFKHQEAANQTFVDNEIKNMLRESGLPENQIESVFSAIVDPKSAVSTTDLGKEIQASVRAHSDMLQSVSEQDMLEANIALDAQLSHLNTLTRRFAPGELGIDVAKGMQVSRKDFSKAAGRLYGRADRLVGDEALVPTKQIKKEASAILDSIPKTAETPGTPAGTTRVQVDMTRGKLFRTVETPATPAQPGRPILGDPRVLKVLADLRQLPDTISFSDAQRIRSTLGELGEMTDLTPGVSKRNFDDLRQSVNVAFSLSKSDPRAAAALRLLKVADKFYADGIEKFEDATINRLVKNIEAGLPPDPSVIADQIVQPGQKARVEQIKKMLPQEVWRRIMGADFDNMIRNATRLIDGEEIVSGKSLKSELDRRGNLIDVVYGPRIANLIREHASRLLARDGKIPATNLAMDNFSATLMRAEAEQQALDEFMKKNFIGALANPNRMPDDVLRWLVQPGQQERLIKTIEFFGEKSPQVQAIRQAALRELLSRATAVTETGTARGVSGEGIESALRQYTHEQQEMLFPNGLADDIRLLAKEVKFIFPGLDDDMAAGLAAGKIKNSSLPMYVVRIIIPTLYGAFLSRPRVMRALALGLRSTGPTRQAAKEAFHNIVRAAIARDAPKAKEAFGNIGRASLGAAAKAANEAFRATGRASLIGAAPQTEGTAQ